MKLHPEQDRILVSVRAYGGSIFEEPRDRHHAKHLNSLVNAGMLRRVTVKGLHRKRLTLTDAGAAWVERATKSEGANPA